MSEGTPIGTFLPLTSLKNLTAQVNFLRWLKKTQQNAWLMSPISDPINKPYKNYGVGYAPIFLENTVDDQRSDDQVNLLDRQDFFSRHRSWLNDYTLHQALSEYFGSDKWWTWPAELHFRQPAALEEWRLRLQNRISFFLDQQYQLANHFAILKAEAVNREISLIGDLPFYVAQESPLVWANQDCFLLRKNGDLKMESGVPSLPDEPFAAQYWGHPLYDWQGVSLEKIIAIFNLRLDFLASIFDLVRIDHANGFFRYGIMYPDQPNWSKKVSGPGKKALNLILEHAQTLELGLFFENIGSQTMRLEQYMKENKIIGMSVLTLAVNLDAEAENQFNKVSRKLLNLDNYQGNQVIFTSTHDTLPLSSWWRILPSAIKNKFLQINNFSPDLTEDKLLSKIRQRLCTNSAKLVIIPWQDWHNLDFRFNVPGHEELADWNHLIESEKYL